MNLGTVLDVVAAVFLLGGSAFALVAAIGVVRLPDLMSRMHAATKPQVIGLMMVLVGFALLLRDPAILGMLVLIVVLQMLTSVISGHMLVRASFRAGQVREDLLEVDELTPLRESWSEHRGAP